MNKVSVIIAAGGSSSRMGGIDKQFAAVDGIPVLARSMMIFEGVEEVCEIIVSCPPEKAEKVKALAGEYGIGKFSHCAEGGRTRQESVINAVKTAAAESNIIAVHDGARPLAGRDAVRQCIKDAAIFGGAVLAVPVKDTIKEADDGMVRDTPDRRRLFMTQTPQIFEKKGFIRAVNFAIDHSLDFTDDCQMAEAVGIRINITPSDYMNIKITTPEDLVIAEALIKNGCADPDREIIKYR
ncbi:MAG: 2-C-methyl-D-erythritol 4-phosphate cytidylyltransferase [Oscillospiraceae bacterium]|nr:2-C-methyl-D-erythritol 4-phosphate cytidylyltransferase [Oscillospiraceae bacterium]